MNSIPAAVERQTLETAEDATLVDASAIQRRLTGYREGLANDASANRAGVTALRGRRRTIEDLPTVETDDEGQWQSRRRQRLPSRIARDLAAAILSGRYKPGDRLFGEIAFSDRLNVSRATYREAIQILATKGMVTANPRGGTIVNARAMWQFLDPEVLSLLFETGPEPGVLDDLRELLDMVAPKAAALAAKRRTDAMLGQMRACIAAMTPTETATPNPKACQEFHTAVFLASGNAYVVSLARGLAAAIDAAMTVQGGPAGIDYLHNHVRILEAIADRDAEGAEKCTRVLIKRAFIEISRRSGRPPDA